MPKIFIRYVINVLYQLARETKEPRGVIAIPRKSISNRRLFIISSPLRAKRAESAKSETRNFRDGGETSPFLLSQFREPWASRSRSQIEIELGNFYFAKTNLRAGRESAGRGRVIAKCGNAPGGGWGYIFKSSRYRRRNSPDKLDQFVRVTFALMYPRLFRLTASYSRGVKFQKTRGAARRGHCHASVAASDFVEVPLRLGVVASRCSFPKLLTSPLARDVVAFCLKGAPHGSGPFRA